MSAHKLYGPKGVGALYVRKGTKLIPLLHGGEQERGYRASTENVPAIVGFGEAVAIAHRKLGEEAKHLVPLRNKLIEGLMGCIDHIHLNGHPKQRLPNNVNVSIEFVAGETMLLNLDLQGIAASTGSACSSGGMEPSHVLLALGLSPDLADDSLRFTLGRETTDEEIDRVLEILPQIVAKLRAMSPLAKSTS
jgi:cysteine desulfurase